MVFVEIIHWIAGVFGCKSSPDSKVFVEKAELDEIVKVVMSGFDSLNSKLDSFENQNSSLKSEIYGRLDYDESRSDELFARFDALQSKFDSLAVGKDDYLGKGDLVELKGNVTNMLSEMKLGIVEKMSCANYASRDDVVRVERGLNEKFADVEGRLFNKLMVDVKNEIKADINVNSSGADSHSVATKSDNVATVLPQVQVSSQEGVLPQQIPEERISVEKPIGVINTVVTEKSIKGKLPAALLPVYSVLLNAEKRISYSELAERVGKKEATARSYVNDLRKYGVSIEEESGSNGRKFIRLSKRVRQEHIIPE